MRNRQFEDWIFVTAAFGEKNFDDAAERLIQQIQGFRIFSAYKKVGLADIDSAELKNLSGVSQEGFEALPGYAYYAWKPLIADMFFKGKFGSYKGIFFLDAGCEAYPNPFNRRQLKIMMRSAERTGALLFSSAVMEKLVTKRELLDRFPKQFQDSEQLATGSWLLFDTMGMRLANKWLEITALPDALAPSTSADLDGFIGHRYEQSTFSLAAKTLGFTPARLWREYPPSGRGLFFTATRGALFPFLWSRNRTGQPTIALAPCFLFGARRKRLHSTVGK